MEEVVKFEGRQVMFRVDPAPRPITEVFNIRVNESDGRIVKQWQSTLEVFRGKRIVGVEEAKDLGGRGFEPGPTRSVDVTIINPEVLDARLLISRGDRL